MIFLSDFIGCLFTKVTIQSTPQRLSLQHLNNHYCNYLRPATLLKMRVWERYFPVNIAKFLRTPFLI